MSSTGPTLSGQEVVERRLGGLQHAGAASDLLTKNVTASLALA